MEFGLAMVLMMVLGSALAGLVRAIPSRRARWDWAQDSVKLWVTVRRYQRVQEQLSQRSEAPSPSQDKGQ